MYVCVCMCVCGNIMQNQWWKLVDLVVSTHQLNTTFALKTSLECGHTETAHVSERMVNLNNNLRASNIRSPKYSWNDLLSSLVFKEMLMMPKRRNCSSCPKGSSPKKVGVTKRTIGEISESIVLTLDRNSHAMKNMPLMISPTLDLSVYCESTLLETLTIQGIEKYRITLIPSLTTSSISMTLVLIQLISEYSFVPALYSLQSVIVCTPESIKSMIAKIPMNNNNNNNNNRISNRNVNEEVKEKEEWIYIPNDCNTIDSYVPVRSQDIFVTDSLDKPNTTYPLPLTHATALRYELVMS
jgi:hypothetical protein